MKLSILSVNSKYIHSSLALWYLTAACEDFCEVAPLEHSINEPSSKILQSVYESRPDILAVCCYIWNIQTVLPLCRELKLILPDIKILLGGPEASFRAEEILKEYPEINAVFLGEGDVSLPAYLKGEIPDGIVYRHGDEIIRKGSYQCIPDLNSIKSPYSEKMLASLSGKLAYFEASRGCPFSCAYCLSSATAGVRYFAIERIKEDILKLLSAKVSTIKFVDRTFNANKPFAKEIIQFLLSLDTSTTFHFEVGADLFDDELLSLLKSAPHGKFQIEAGIQSTNQSTLNAVCRTTDTKHALAVLKEISAYGNIHVHSDLICGLPSEDLASFKNSFDELFATRSHALQVGFLKLLHGSSLRETFAGKFSPFAPYQVLETESLSVDDLFFLQDFENAVELFYNSGRFTCTINYLATCFSSAFELFKDLALQLNGKSSLAPDNLFYILSEFCKKTPDLDVNRCEAALSFDYISCFKARYLPEFLVEPKDGFHLAENHEIPAVSHIPVKVLVKNVAIKIFPYDMQNPHLPSETSVYLFSRRERCPVTSRFKVEKL